MLARLNDEIKTAMKSRDSERLSVLRGLMAGAKNIAIADKRKDVTDSDLMAAVIKGIKQRQDSIEQFESAGRNDLVKIEAFEMEIYKEFQPKQMSEDEVTAIILKTITEVGAESKKDMGKVMGALMPKVKGKADGKLVSKIVGEKLG